MQLFSIVRSGWLFLLRPTSAPMWRARRRKLRWLPRIFAGQSLVILSFTKDDHAKWLRWDGSAPMCPLSRGASRRRLLQTCGLARSPQHREHGRRVPHAYDAQRLEPEPLVQRSVGGVAGFQIGRQVLLVAPAERFRQQRRAEAPRGEDGAQPRLSAGTNAVRVDGRPPSRRKYQARWARLGRAN
jgi:hypothetical protein